MIESRIVHLARELERDRLARSTAPNIPGVQLRAGKSVSIQTKNIGRCYFWRRNNVSDIGVPAFFDYRDPVKGVGLLGRCICAGGGNSPLHRGVATTTYLHA